jgi:P4 family phage/plasmid primase-like protien
MVNNLLSILEKSRVNENEIHHTHVSLFNPRGRFSIRQDDLDTFFDLYHEHVSVKHKKVGLAEKPMGYIPVMADVDIKKPYTKDESNPFQPNGKLYSDEQLNTVVSIYQSIIREIVADYTDRHLICVVLEKTPYTVEKNGNLSLKNGFHLHFPYLFLKPCSIEVHLIPRVQKEVDELKIFENLGLTNSSDIIDKACCKNQWLMYGASKSEELEPYLISKIYDGEMNVIDLEKAFSSYQIYNKSGHLINISENGGVVKNLPRIMSIIPHNRQVAELKPGLISLIKDQIKKKKKEKKEYSTEDVEKEIKTAKRLLDMVADFRANDYDDWMAVGRALFNISNGSIEGLDLWCDFSSRCIDKYDENHCVSLWNKMIRSDYSMGTIKWFAGKDNPVEYKKYKDEIMSHYIKESLNGTHTDVANMLYADFGDEFVCVSITNKIWYQFVGHRWEPIEEGVFLRNKISNEIAATYIAAFQANAQQMGKDNDDSIQQRMKQLQKMTNNCKHASFKASVMREAADIFYDKRFKEKLDMNPYLIGFRNGVYDLKQHIFRAGRPEDFISKSMPIDYFEFNDHDERVEFVHSFFEKIFPDKSLRTYFFDVISDTFVGGNRRKAVIFWTGDGNNGKSVTQTLLERMFGQYAIKFPTTLITGKKPASGAAYPDLARSGGGVRFAVLEEPNEDEQVNVGTLKMLSGNDSFYARDLFEKGKDGKEIIPMFHLHFICNKLPVLKFADQATFNRVEVLPFESQFIDPLGKHKKLLPATFEEQLKEKKFPMDKEIGSKYAEMASPLAWILLNHRKNNKYRVIPEKVRQATLEYQKTNDIYRQFVDTYIISEINPNAYVSLAELYITYKAWVTECFPHRTISNRTDFAEYFQKLWGTMERGQKWANKRFRKDDDQDIEFVIVDE